MQSGDILSDKDAIYLSKLEALWDMVSDMVEDGRLSKSDIPGDYDALVCKMVELESTRAGLEDED